LKVAPGAIYPGTIGTGADVETLVVGGQEAGGDLQAAKEDPDKPNLLCKICNIRYVLTYVLMITYCGEIKHLIKHYIPIHYFIL